MPSKLMTPVEAKARLGDPDFVLLDCREPKEIAIARVAGAMEIPVRDSPRRLPEIDRAKKIAVMCHHGMRSAQVADYLTNIGYPRVSSVAGGIDAWSLQIDPTMRRY